MSPIQPYVPEGFEAFWHDTYFHAEEAALDFGLGEIAQVGELGPGQMAAGTTSAGHEIRTFTFRSIAGERLNGWIATPFEAVDQALPAFLWIQPYGRESVLPNQYGTREGFISLSFNFFGEPPFHREKYEPVRGYFGQGVEEPESWIFRSMFQNAVLASRVLSALPGVDKTRIGSMGMSQGGGISIWLGAWSPLVKAVCADMPFLGAMHQTLLKSVYRYPLKEIFDWIGEDNRRQEAVLRTISYYDTLNQATRCDKPTLLSVGLKDPSVRVPQVEAIYSALPGEKKLQVYDWGHDWHSDMVANNRNWLLQHLPYTR